MLDALTSLVAKSMLNTDRSATGPTRYHMLESLRHYARERLDAAGGADETRRGHARHYAAAVSGCHSQPPRGASSSSGEQPIGSSSGGSTRSG